jgi:hypothetical protein
MRRNVLNAAVVADYFLCPICGERKHRLLAKLDHKEPVIDPRVGFIDWNTYIDRLFCDPSNLQVICIDCHTKKTKDENDLRKKYKTGKSSDAHKQRLSNIRRGLPQTPAREAVRRKMVADLQKPVLTTCIETGKIEEFPSVTAASIALDIESCNISRVCNKKQGRTQVEGYFCEWKKTAEQRRKK